MKRLISVVASTFAIGILATPVFAAGELVCIYGGEGDFFRAEPYDPGLPIGEVIVEDHYAESWDDSMVYVIGQGDWTTYFDCPSAILMEYGQTRDFMPDRPFSAVPHPDPSMDSIHDTFDIDPNTIHQGHVVHEVELYAGGVIQSAGAVPGRDCDVGRIGRAPDFRVNYTNSDDFSILNFQIFDEMEVALAVRQPNGRWTCRHPRAGATWFHHHDARVIVPLSVGAPGHYDVWVGVLSDSADSTIPVNLQVFMN